MSFQRIVVAVDGSAIADAALVQALYLSRALHAALCVIHVIDAFPVYNLAMGIDFDRCRELFRSEGLGILENAQKTAQTLNVAIETQLVEIIDSAKKVSEKVIETVRGTKADLLVLGTHGRRGFRRLILGSVAEEALRISPVPVLLVRADEGSADYYRQKQGFSCKRIVAAVDGSETSTQALDRAIELARAFDASLSILHVAHEYTSRDFFFAKQLLEYQESVKQRGVQILEHAGQACKEQGIKARTELIEITDKQDGISTQIINSVLSCKADLLVIGTHGRSGINRFLIGSVAEETARIAPIPVLLVRGEK